MSVDARIRTGLALIEQELPTADPVVGLQELERSIRRDTRRRVLVAVAAAVVLVATTAGLLARAGDHRVQPAPSPARPLRILMYDPQSATIALVGQDGSEHTLPMRNVDRFAVSPDGRRIAYITYHPAAGTRTLGMADADGTHPTRLRPPCAGCEPGYGVTWSHDGTRLAYSVFTPGKKPTQVRIRTVATGDEQTFTMPAGVDPRGPVFSPDDQTLAVNAATATGQYVAKFAPNVGLTSWTHLSDSYQQVQAPSWSADGRTVYFTATTRGDDTNDTSASTDLFAVDADGTHLRQLTHAEPGERFFAASAHGNRFLISRAQGDTPWQVGWLTGDNGTFKPIRTDGGRPLEGNGAVLLP